MLTAMHHQSSAELCRGQKLRGEGKTGWEEINLNQRRSSSGEGQGPARNGREEENWVYPLCVVGMGPYGLALGWPRAEMDEKKPNIYSMIRPDYAFWLGRNGLQGRDQNSVLDTRCKGNPVRYWSEGGWMVIPEIQVPASSFCKNTVLTQYG